MMQAAQCVHPQGSLDLCKAYVPQVKTICTLCKMDAGMEGGLCIAASVSSNVQSAIFESKENQISSRHMRIKGHVVHVRMQARVIWNVKDTHLP